MLESTHTGALIRADIPFCTENKGSHSCTFIKQTEN